MDRPRGRLHYGWVVVACGSLVLFACLGLARFAYGMLLPSMSADLALSYADGGAIGTGYFVGYLAVVVAIPFLLGRVGSRVLVAAGLALIAASLAGLSRGTGFWPVLALYTVTGVGSGMANITMVALISRWFAPSMRGRAAGIVLGGNGVGIILSGVLVPLLEDAGVGEVWRASWLILAGLTAGVALVAGTLLRNDPADLGLRPVGAGPLAAATAAKPAPSRAAERRLLVHLGLVYALFGATYIIYGTFIVTTLVDAYRYPADIAGTLWAWIGFLSIFSGASFGALSDRIGRRGGLMAAFSVLTAAFLLAALEPGEPLLYLSIGLFGIAAWSVPTIASAAAGDYLGPLRAAAGLSFITLFFAVGQVAGPLSAGALAEALGSFAPAYGLAAGLTALAVVLAAFLKPPAGNA
ncbi:MAG: YbfB/YjiJ family MFS transporter [Hyphomicrobiales bacterium]|nr:YbfB/YjiJ family MFS transporter [Hyphomicrobiales bacterium]MCP5372544.1 YbfB/YjiJ family MFS transporter [Hyphomicrobiales bacterium]